MVIIVSKKALNQAEEIIEVYTCAISTGSSKSEYCVR